MLDIVYKPVAELTSAELLRLRDIAAPHYVDASSLLARDMEHCSHIYLSRFNNEIRAFFLVAWETLIVENRVCPSLFLGFSCADNNYRKSKVTSLAYIQAGIDMAKWKEMHKSDIIVWGTTATSIVLKLVPKFWNLIQPDLTGAYDTHYTPIANAIRQKYFAHGLPSDHPYVLKGVATGTRYSEEERTYLESVALKINLPIFEQLGIDETQGDRLLMLMDVPDAEKLTWLKSELADILKTAPTL